MKNKRDILIMGASAKALEIRVACMKKHHQTNDKVFFLGDDTWLSSIITYWPPSSIICGISDLLFFKKGVWIPGKSTAETLQNFKEISSSNSHRLLVISGWYHLPRCWLILRFLGFRRIRLVPSTWRWWETPWRTIMNEMRSLRGCFE